MADYENKIDEIVTANRETDSNMTSQKYYYKDNIESKVIPSDSNIELKSYIIPEDGIYIIQCYSCWEDFSNVAASRYNIVQQFRDTNLIDTTIDGDAGYNAGTSQYTNTTAIFSCKKNDVLKFLVSQYSSSNKTISGSFKLTRLY